MKMIRFSKNEIEELASLKAARKIANFALSINLVNKSKVGRSTYNHLGAVIAETALQAGLNYRTVVLPRIKRILTLYPRTDTINKINNIVLENSIPDYLNWSHKNKINVFHDLIIALNCYRVNDTYDLAIVLRNTEFRNRLLSINGVGSKSVDYMSCLVGIENIPIDRHIRAFAVEAGVINNSYEFLGDSFNYAADLLSISRREFDALIWGYKSSLANKSAA